MRLSGHKFRFFRPFRSHSPYIASRTRRSYSRPPVISPADGLVEEERAPGYRPEFFYPANPGQVLNSRYKILTKIGWGRASTVWLAEDLEREPYQHVAIKITSSDPEYGDVVLHELEINRRFTEDPSLVGFAFIRAAFDDFMAVGPNGSAHLCLVFELLREPLSQFQHRLVGDRIPPQLLKVLSFVLSQLSQIFPDMIMN